MLPKSIEKVEPYFSAIAQRSVDYSSLRWKKVFLPTAIFIWEIRRCMKTPNKRLRSNNCAENNIPYIPMIPYIATPKFPALAHAGSWCGFSVITSCDAAMYCKVSLYSGFGMGGEHAQESHCSKCLNTIKLFAKRVTFALRTYIFIFMSSFNKSGIVSISKI